MRILPKLVFSKSQTPLRLRAVVVAAMYACWSCRTHCVFPFYCHTFLLYIFRLIECYSFVLSCIHIHIIYISRNYIYNIFFLIFSPSLVVRLTVAKCQLMLLHISGFVQLHATRQPLSMRAFRVRALSVALKKILYDYTVVYSTSAASSALV